MIAALPFECMPVMLIALKLRQEKNCLANAEYILKSIIFFFTAQYHDFLTYRSSPAVLPRWIEEEKNYSAEKREI